MLFPAAKTPGAMIPIQMDSGSSSSSGSWLHTAFHDLIDVVNPLQHLPVVGTLYRAATGDHIGTLEKIAGDTLYGGLWGAASSVADTAFEAMTGKDFGDTVLGFLTGDGDAPKTAVASAVPPAQAISTPQAASTQTAANTSAPAPQTGDVAALTQALGAKGVGGDTAARALYAYRRATSVNGAVLASVN